MADPLGVYWGMYNQKAGEMGLPVIATREEFAQRFPNFQTTADTWLSSLAADKAAKDAAAATAAETKRMEQFAAIVNPPVPETPATPVGPSPEEKAATERLAATNQQISSAQTQANTDIANMQTIIQDYMKADNPEARRVAEYAKIETETQKALTEATKKYKSEAATRGGLYGGGLEGVMGEAQVAGELSKVERKAGFETTLATEQSQKKLQGVSMLVDTYKTKIGTAQSYAQMAQAQGQYDVSLAWQKESERLSREANEKWNTIKVKVDKLNQDIAIAEKALDRAWQTGENDKARQLQLQIAEMNQEAQEAQASSTLWGGLGTAAGLILGGPIGGVILGTATKTVTETKPG